MTTRRLTVGGWFAAVVGVATLVALAAIVACLLALSRLSDARNLVLDQLDPAAFATQRLRAGLLDEETGVRGFALVQRDDFLTPFTRGRVRTGRALRELDGLTRDEDLESLATDVARVRTSAFLWRVGYAQPTVDRVRAGGTSQARGLTAEEGRRRFDQVRRNLATLDRRVLALRAEGRVDQRDAARDLNRLLVLAGVVIVLTLVLAGFLLQRVVIRPVNRLGESVRRVSEGGFGLPVEPTGPADVRRLGADVEAMRQRIEDARAMLEAQATDLQRSNAELEQFAYVASHDLQEPLRKVASFCQMLERRYGDQLDERGRQYIDFAVDGAKRMQQLINDLLAFSRVGRVTRPHEEVSLAAVAERALSSLETVVEETGATIELADDLPTVHGDATLLALVLQNLIGNAIKFRRPDVAPVVRVTCEGRDDGHFELAVADNGIGIEEQYADRIFVIFQRLHAREAYEGTGIGLAMCRKVVEYHGGELWLDTTRDPADGPGSTFRFTLPVETPDDGQEGPA
ncbi:ATP-binding protein [Conexibacter sp. SYSU D00693]|uniref:sensor histidine kinase n=1 Tax=Conexibacter sp. SYSU D00693 TaxID=2812560 RepID=UPI00196A2560|nr:sensor histidine kinase [Conexibacter sp. SYSU D00693]